MAEWLNEIMSGLPGWMPLVALPILGLIAGFINTMAGGGSFLTLPALMFFFHLDPQVANGTNRLSVLLQTGTGAAVFHKHGFTDIKLALRLIVPALIGSTVGGAIATVLPSEMFEFVFGVVMIVMAVVLVFKPKLLLATERHPMKNPAAEFAIFMGIGLYGGFLQAGVGLLLLTGLALFHAKDLLKSNAVKITIAFLQTIPPIAIFAYAGQIDYVYGLLLAVGTVSGALLGARFAIRKGTKAIFYFVVGVAILTGGKLVYSSISQFL